MKRFLLLSAALCLLALPVHAQNLWSAKFDTFGNFTQSSSNPLANGVISTFTPATSITVNRIEVSSPGGGLGCNPLPRIKVTDGTTSISVSIPNSTSTTQFNPVTNNSGSISQTFAAGDKLKIVLVPGGCASNSDYPFETSINVQYSTN